MLLDIGNFCTFGLLRESALTALDHTHTHMDESQITVMADDFESKELRGLARCHDG